MRSQISTITVATFNTTLASFNVGYADFFSEHMRKLCNQVPIPEMPHEPLACANLPRSLTDSCINYSYLEDTEHIDGTNNFVHKNGMLDLSVRSKNFSYQSLDILTLWPGFCHAMKRAYRFLARLNLKMKSLPTEKISQMCQPSQRHLSLLIFFRHDIRCDLISEYFYNPKTLANPE